jgi:hypothetical protein
VLGACGSAAAAAGLAGVELAKTVIEGHSLRKKRETPAQQQGMLTSVASTLVSDVGAAIGAITDACQ